MTHDILSIRSPERPKERPEQYQEVERQFTTDYPAAFEHLKGSADVEIITHRYLSHPDEEFSLRISEVATSGGASCVATLKDRGKLTHKGLKRLEIETPVSEAAFRYYEGRGGYATLRKLRVRPASGVTIDWYEADEPPVIEVEDGPDKQGVAEFYHRYSPYLIDRTGHADVSSEALAYRLSPDVKRPSGAEVSAETIIATIQAAQAAGAGQLTVGIAGRSGSGKSTITREVVGRLLGNGHDLSVTCLSSDDYHRGKKWLDTHNGGESWQDWDAGLVYDTGAMAEDIARLMSGEAVPRRSYDFVTQEPVTEGRVDPGDIVLIEGICAASADLAAVRDFLFVLPVPAATSIGRRLRRDVGEGRLNASLGSLPDILRYQLEYAEPAHLERIDDLSSGS